MTPKHPFHIVREISSGCVYGAESFQRKQTQRETQGLVGDYLGQACEMPVPKWYWPVGTEGGGCGLFPDAHTVVTGEC